MLDIRSVSKSFGDNRVLNDVSINVRRGDRVAVIGPNGAGKTTLFNLICGQLQPDKGKILLADEDIGKFPPHVICRKGIARSFQIANIFPRLSVFRNVQVSVLSQQKLSNKLFQPAAQLAVDETNHILISVGLLDKKMDLAGSLSHGDKRILEIAIALGNEPQLLILDEPTAGMSPDETTATMALIQRLAAEQGAKLAAALLAGRLRRIREPLQDLESVLAAGAFVLVERHGVSLRRGQAIPEEYSRRLRK